MQSQVDSIRFMPDCKQELTCLSPNATTGLSETRPASAPAVYVIRLSDVGKLAACKDCIDCNTQKRTGKSNTTIQLSRYVLGKYPRIPLLRTCYESAGRLVAGIRALFDKARSADEKNVYIIGAGEMVYETLLAEVKRNKGPTGTARRVFLHGIVVDKDLERTYLGWSAMFDEVRKRIIVAAGCDLTTLIYGDTGTGKELIARAIHQRSSREGTGKYLIVNCGGIPHDLLETELFGCEPHVVTGVPKLKIGMWEDANNGTLFLDEVGDMSPDHQARVLRALENGKIRRVGGNEEIKVNTRIIAATNRDLKALMDRGLFRRDLYARLTGMTIYAPALRESADDLEMLAQELWRSITRGKLPALTSALIALLPKYTRTGNVRQLQNILNRLAAYMKAEHITEIDTRYFEDAVRDPWEGLVPNQPNAPDPKVGAYRATCLETLRRASKSVRKCETLIRPFLKTKKPDGQWVEVLLFGLRRLTEELERDCGDPSAFFTHEAFTAVTDFRDGMARTANRIEDKPSQAGDAWETDLRALYHQALSRIADAIRCLQ